MGWPVEPSDHDIGRDEELVGEVGPPYGGIMFVGDWLNAGLTGGPGGGGTAAVSSVGLGHSPST